ncbi:MAG: DUF4172 domain-containing protein [Planctomycetaceae bacterium]|nr:DUF4172 domain-containing protein [Planctomycetaceae bacterium]
MRPLTEPAAPTFIWNDSQLLRAEWLFLAESALVSGKVRHLAAVDQGEVMMETLVRDAVASLEIEGDVADSQRVEAGIRHRLGLAMDDAGADRQELGIAKLAIDIIQTYEKRLDRRTLATWQSRIYADDEAGVEADGAGKKPWKMAVNNHNAASGERDLKRFLAWLALDNGHQDRPSPLVRAGLAHLWLESIQPFPRGTGVLGRAVAEQALIHDLPNHMFIPLNQVFLKYRHEYHNRLDDACRDRDATEWLAWFAAAAVEACRLARARMEFAINQAQLLESLRDSICGRQEAILTHLFNQGPEGFPRGVSPSGFAREHDRPISDVSRDMTALAHKGALVRSVRGGRMRYHLNVPNPRVARVRTEDVL